MLNANDTTTSLKHRRWLWLGFWLALVAVLANAAFFVSVAGQDTLTWISAALTVIALAVVILGLVRTYSRPSDGRLRSSLIGGLALLLVAFSTVTFYTARSLPSSPRAPGVGQRAPDFTLPDTTGQPVTLSKVLAPGDKAVLLVFYRGYW